MKEKDTERSGGVVTSLGKGSEGWRVENEGRKVEETITARDWYVPLTVSVSPQLVTLSNNPNDPEREENVPADLCSVTRAATNLNDLLMVKKSKLGGISSGRLTGANGKDTEHSGDVLTGLGKGGEGRDGLEKMGKVVERITVRDGYVPLAISVSPQPVTPPGDTVDVCDANVMRTDAAISQASENVADDSPNPGTANSTTTRHDTAVIDADVTEPSAKPRKTTKREGAELPTRNDVPIPESMEPSEDCRRTQRGEGELEPGRIDEREKGVTSGDENADIWFEGEIMDIAPEVVRRMDEGLLGEVITHDDEASAKPHETTNRERMELLTRNDKPVPKSTVPSEDCQRTQRGEGMLKPGRIGEGENGVMEATASTPTSGWHTDHDNWRP
jgi:hypothetical protein